MDIPIIYKPWINYIVILIAQLIFAVALTTKKDKS